MSALLWEAYANIAALYLSLRHRRWYSVRYESMHIIMPRLTYERWMLIAPRSAKKAERRVILRSNFPKV